MLNAKSTRNNTRPNQPGATFTRWWARSLTLMILMVTVVLTTGVPVLAQDQNTPARPTGLTGEVRHDRVALSWDDPGDSSITSYQILRLDRDVHGVGNFQIREDDTGSSANAYTDTNVTVDTRYVYRIKARNANGLSPQSGYFDANVPHPPAVTVSFAQSNYTVAEGESVTVTVQLDQDPQRDVVIELDATEQNGATDTDYSGVPETVAFSDGQPTATFTLTAADDDDDDDGESVVLSFASDLPDRVSAGSTSTATVAITDNDEPAVDQPAAPNRPTGLTGTVRHDRVALTWDNPNDETITSYQILRRDTTEHQLGEFIVLVETTGSPATTYTEQTVEAGTWYVYRIKARNSGGLSPQSNYFDARVPLPPQVTASFQQSTLTVAQGQQVTVTAVLDTDPQRDVTIKIAASHQGELTDTDYSGVPESVTFTDGQTTASFTVTAATGSELNDDDALVLTLSTDDLPDRVTIGSANTATIAVTETDDNGQNSAQPLTDPGDTFDTAHDLGNLNDVSTSLVITETVTPTTDRYDYYKVTVTTSTYLGAVLKDLEDNANLYVKGSFGQPLGRAEAPSTNTEYISAAVAQGTYYIVVAAAAADEAPYTLEIRQGVGTTISITIPATAPFTPATPPEPTHLGDITDLPKTFINVSVNGTDKPVARYQFTINEWRLVSLQLRRQDANADLYVDDEDGNPLYGSFNSDHQDERINQSLWAGTYYIRIEAQETGQNDLILRHETFVTDFDNVPDFWDVDTSQLDLNPDTVPSRANDLSDITGEESLPEIGGTVGGSDRADHYKFVLTAQQNTRLGFDNRGGKAKISLLSQDGESIASSSDDIIRNLQIGTYYIRVTTDEQSRSPYTLSYGPEFEFLFSRINIVSRTLVSNSNQRSYSFPPHEYHRGYVFLLHFTTGTNPHGYWLTDVVVSFVAANSTTPIPGADNLKVSLHDGGGTEYNKVADLNNPSNLDTAGDKTFTPTQAIVLYPRRDYHIRVEVPRSKEIVLRHTAQHFEDSDRAPGFSIHDVSYRRYIDDNDNKGHWDERERIPKFKINGAIKDRTLVWEGTLTVAAESNDFHDNGDSATGYSAIGTTAGTLSPNTFEFNWRSDYINQRVWERQGKTNIPPLDGAGIRSAALAHIEASDDDPIDLLTDARITWLIDQQPSRLTDDERLWLTTDEIALSIAAEIIDIR